MDESSKCSRALERARSRIGNLRTPQANRRAILAFADACFAEGLGERRVLKYLWTLCRLASWMGTKFEDSTREDIERISRTIETSAYAEWTKHDYRVTLKKFFKWLRRTEDGYPPEVRWLRTTLRKSRTRLPEEILTQQEVERLISAATNSRDRALVACLYESGCRIGEMLGLTLRQVHTHPHGYQITVSGKKGSRRLLLIASTPYLAAWLNEHPGRDSPDAALWATTDYRAGPVGHARAAAILRRTAKRATVKKAVNPHNFRHSRATHLAQHLTEAQMNEFFGWAQGSDMPSTYVHLSGRDIDRALLKLNNITVGESAKARSNFTQRQCPRCGLDNAPANRFCSRCGMILDEEEARQVMTSSTERARVDGVMDRLIQDPEFQEMLVRKLKALESPRV